MLPAELIERRRLRVAAAWKSEPAALERAVVLVGAGHPIGLPGGQDQTYDFRVHPDYRWLTGCDAPAGVLAYDAEGEGGSSVGHWVDFRAEVTEAERVWEGREPHEVPNTRLLSEFAEWLRARAGRPIVGLGVPPSGTASDANGLERACRLGELLVHARRPKDAHEIELLRRAIAATARGFAVARDLLAGAEVGRGLTERLVQIELEAAMYRAGAEGVGYGTLVGSGQNAAVLHFAPSHRTIGPNELVLIDAGGMIGGYTADVTRTFITRPTRGQVADERQALYDIVLQAQIRAIERCRPGLSWRDMHTRTAVDLAEGLVSMGVMKGRGESLAEREAIALFFPHGVGHMVGLGVRDAGGRRPGAASAATPALKCCGVSLRVDLPLEAGYLMTIEPGLYFIRALLDDPARRERFADCVDWTRVDHLLKEGIGGVRIEDNILIAESGPVNLTAAIEK